MHQQTIIIIIARKFRSQQIVNVAPLKLIT